MGKNYANISLILAHYPVYNKNKEVVVSSVTTALGAIQFTFILFSPSSRARALVIPITAALLAI